MFPLKKILLPVDFSGRCRAAARYAGSLTTHFGAQLTLLHVPDNLAAAASSFHASSEGLGCEPLSPASRFKGELASFAGAELPGVKPRCEVVPGDPAEVIASFAHTNGTDLIVLPTHGRSPTPRFALGSVTAKVLHASECPVCTGARWCDEPLAATYPPRVVLCAIDLGPTSGGVLSFAAQVASHCGARLVIVYAAPSAGIEASAGIEHLRLEHVPSAISPKVWIEPGEPVRVVCESAERFEAGLVVIGRSVEKGVRLRPNAYAIIRHSPCPVFSI